MTDITISLDDILELDTIIEASGKASDPVKITDGTEGTDFDLEDIQTHTSIFNPTNPGTYNIEVNGQKLTIKVLDPKNIPDTLVNNSVLNDFYSVNTKSPGDYTLKSDSIVLNGVDTGTGSDSSWAELETSQDLDKGSLSEAKIDFSLTQSGDNDANSRDYRFVIYEGTLKPDNIIAEFGDIGSKGNTGYNLSRDVRTVDLSGVSGTGSLKYRSYRTSSGNYERFSGSVTIYNIEYN
jgi:hypothetical protein